jgi:hypothetical protein
MLLVFLLLLPPLHIQDFDYGRPTDLKGIKKVFIDTGSDLKNHERIVKSLEDAKLNLEILDSPEGAEVFLVFNAGSEQRIVGILNSAGGVLNQRKFRTGQGMVYLPQSNGRPRVVLSFEDTQNSGWERKPVTNFSREFIKLYKKANSIK